MFARAAASIVLAGAVVLGTAGCNFVAPQRTLDLYTPGAGVSATVGGVEVLNAIALANEDGSAIHLLFSIANNTDRGQTVNLQFEADGEKVNESRFVNAGSLKSIGYGPGEEGPIFITGADAEPGGSLAVYVQWGSETGQTVLVPVYDSSLEQYQDYVPEVATLELQQG